MLKWQLKSPATAAEWHAYYQLRYWVLRQPWGQPLGSEQDELESSSFHQMVQAENGEVLAVGRLHSLASQWGQVRYMAVAEQARGMGLGAKVLQALERQAIEQRLQGITLNARENAIGFYRKHGYQLEESLAPMFGIAHQRMSKQLQLAGHEPQWQQWCQQLLATWHQTIPVSAFMQLSIRNFDGYKLQCQAPLAPNINLHQTMFAGSIYTSLTLTGWGLVWLQLQALGLAGDIVLGEASIKYLKPVQEHGYTEARLADTDGSLAELASGRRVRQWVVVEFVHANEVMARFRGRFAVLPMKKAAT